MKKVLFALAMLAASGCQAAHTQFAVPKKPSAAPATYQDRGIEEAVVCKSKSDAKAYVKFAGDNDGDGFAKFTKSQIASGGCKFLGNSDTITVVEHDVVLTDNGPLFVIKFTQGKDSWWSSANYFPASYPMSGMWEDELTGKPIEGQLGEDE